MNKIFPAILCLIIGLLGGCAINIGHSNYNQSQLIKAYEQYYSNTEHLLDDLDSAYNWVDGYDSYEYYSSKAKVDSLANNIH